MEHWLVSVNKVFHSALKHYFISKTIICFWHSCIIVFSFSSL